jgi:hypothetical protein
MTSERRLVLEQTSRFVGLVQRWLDAIYRLGLDLDADRYVVPPEHARELLPEGAPRSGLLVVEEEDGEVLLGVYVDPEDVWDGDTIVEETSHLVCVAWHAARRQRVSQLHLELQSEVDRYVVARLAYGRGFDHFENFRWDDRLGPEERRRYETAHRVAHRYCRGLQSRHPSRADTPGLLAELRHFYRRPPQEKLNAA